MHPEGAYLSNEKTYQKHPIFLRGPESYTLRGDVHFSAILPKTGTQASPPAAYTLEAEKQSLSSSRIGFDCSLYYGSWNEANLRYSNSALQQLFSTSFGSGEFPQSFHFAGILERSDFFGIERNHPSSRSSPSEDICPSQSSNELGLRFGFCGSSYFWLEDSRSQSWLQSQKSTDAPVIGLWSASKGTVEILGVAYSFPETPIQSQQLSNSGLLFKPKFPNTSTAYASVPTPVSSTTNSSNFSTRKT